MDCEYLLPIKVSGINSILFVSFNTGKLYDSAGQVMSADISEKIFAALRSKRQVPQVPLETIQNIMDKKREFSTKDSLIIEDERLEQT